MIKVTHNLNELTTHFNYNQRILLNSIEKFKSADAGEIFFDKQGRQYTKWNPSSRFLQIFAKAVNFFIQLAKEGFGEKTRMSNRQVNVFHYRQQILADMTELMKDSLEVLKTANEEFPQEISLLSGLGPVSVQKNLLKHLEDFILRDAPTKFDKVPFRFQLHRLQEQALSLIHQMPIRHGMTPEWFVSSRKREIEQLIK